MKYCLFLAYLLNVSCVSALAEPIDITTKPISFGAERAGALEFLAGLVLTSQSNAFGGISELDISADGSAFIAITDRGNWLWAELVLNNGLPTGIGAADITPIKDGQGRPIQSPRNDAEGLIIDANRAYVSFETYDRISLFEYPSDLHEPFHQRPDLAALKAQPFPLPDALLRHPQNRGLEAIARLKDQRLILFSEKGQSSKGHGNVWTYDQKSAKVEALWLDAPNGFYPTAADTLPNGDLIVLLRKFSPFSGLSIMLRHISESAIMAGAVISGKTIAQIEPPLMIDNMEGLSIRQDEEGRTLLYLISDDNFSALQRTLLLVFEYRGGQN